MTIIDQMGFIQIYRISNPITIEYTFSSEAHGALSKIGHILEKNQVFMNT
jgi:hypothetical protein